MKPSSRATINGRQVECLSASDLARRVLCSTATASRLVSTGRIRAVNGGQSSHAYFATEDLDEIRKGNVADLRKKAGGLTMEETLGLLGETLEEITEMLPKLEAALRKRQAEEARK